MNQIGRCSGRRPRSALSKGEVDVNVDTAGSVVPVLVPGSLPTSGVTIAAILADPFDHPCRHRPWPGGLRDAVSARRGLPSVTINLRSEVMSDRAGAAATAIPAVFVDAVASLRTVIPRPEITLDKIAGPARLAPYSHAVGAEVSVDGEEIATARFVVLHDPDGQAGWDGVLRIVGFLTAETDAALASDELFPEVGWSWLLEALDGRGAEHTAVGGTVTSTASTRFGDIAGPQRSVDVEIRASWTALTFDLSAHLRAWLDVLAAAAGLPPPGVRLLSSPQGSGSARQLPK